MCDYLHTRPICVSCSNPVNLHQHESKNCIDTYCTLFKAILNVNFLPCSANQVLIRLYVAPNAIRMRKTTYKYLEISSWDKCAYSPGLDSYESFIELSI